jgi:hypothetical protein
VLNAEITREAPAFLFAGVEAELGSVFDVARLALWTGLTR